METPNPRLVRDIREGFFEKETFKMILETTGHQSGKSVIPAEETNAKTLDLRYFKKISKSSVAGLQRIEGESSVVRGRGQVPMTEQGRETQKGF